MNPPVEISPEALEAFRAQLGKTTGVKAVRLGLKGGGCSGFSYVIEFDYNDVRTGDNEWQLDDVTFRVDKKSTLYLAGSRLGWKKTLMATGFEFENPQEASKCGCGHSFNVK